MKNEAEVDLYVFKWHFGFRVSVRFNHLTIYRAYIVLYQAQVFIMHCTENAVRRIIIPWAVYAMHYRYILIAAPGIPCAVPSTGIYHTPYREYRARMHTTCAAVPYTPHEDCSVYY